MITEKKEGIKAKTPEQPIKKYWDIVNFIKLITSIHSSVYAKVIIQLTCHNAVGAIKPRLHIVAVLYPHSNIFYGACRCIQKGPNGAHWEAPTQRLSKSSFANPWHRSGYKRTEYRHPSQSRGLEWLEGLVQDCYRWFRPHATYLLMGRYHFGAHI